MYVRVLVPQAWLPEPDQRASGHACLADIPAPQLAPVHLAFARTERGLGNGVGPFTTQDPKCESGDGIHLALLVEKVAAEDPVIQCGVHPAIGGSIRTRRHAVQIVEREAACARAIFVDQQEEHGCTLGQAGDTGKQIR